MTKEKLISELILNSYLKTPSIIEAFEKIDRKDFVPDFEKENCYLNSALPIGYDQTISQPLTVAFMLELLEPKQNEKILDIGAGSGWQAALLGETVGNHGKIISVERIPGLVKMAKENISKYNLLKKRIEVIEGDGSKGYEKEAPYDKIIAAASASKIPASWKIQLKIGGLIVAPVRNSIIKLEKKSAAEFEKNKYFGFSFVPLITENYPQASNLTL